MLRARLLALALILCPAVSVLAQQPPGDGSPAEKEAREKEARQNLEKARKGTEVMGMGLLMFAGMAIGVVVFSMIPTAIAALRGHPQLIPLAIVNFFLGWTCIGFIGCLAWSFISTPEPEQPQRRRRRSDDYDD